MFRTTFHTISLSTAIVLLPGLSYASGVFNPGCSGSTCILNQTTNQAGATMYPDSGTINQQLTVNGSGLSNKTPAFSVMGSTFNALVGGAVVVGSTQTADNQGFTVTLNTGTFQAGPTGTAMHLVAANGSNAQYVMDTIGSGAFGTNASAVRFRKIDNTAQSPSAIISGDILGYVLFDGYDGTGFVGTFGGVGIYGTATENWTSSTHGTKMQFATSGNTGTGRGVFQNALLIDQSGNIVAGNQTSAPTNVLFTMQSSTTNAYEFVAGTGTATTQWHVMISTSGHFITANSSAPTITSCGTGTPTVSGDDIEGTISTGGTTVTACTLTFIKPFAITPTCTHNSSSSVATPYISSISTTSVTFGLSSSVANGKIYYHCGCSGTSCL